MQKTKIQFKAIRESLGLTAKNIAEAVNVKQATVLAWDNNNRSDIKPSQAGWDYLEEVLAEQSEKIILAIEKVAEHGKSTGSAGTLALVYYRSQDDYEKHGNKGSYSVHNATMRAVAVAVQEEFHEAPIIQFIESSIDGNIDVTGLDNPIVFP